MTIINPVATIVIAVINIPRRTAVPLLLPTGQSVTPTSDKSWLSISVKSESEIWLFNYLLKFVMQM